MALDTDFIYMKKTFVSYPVFLIISDWNVSVHFGTPCMQHGSQMFAYKMSLYTEFSDKKFCFVSYPVFLIINDWNVSVPFGTPCIAALSDFVKNGFNLRCN